MGYEGTPVGDRSMGEVALPLRTLISTWQTRAEIAFFSAFVDACPEIAKCLFSGAAEDVLQAGLSSSSR